MTGERLLESHWIGKKKRGNVFYFFIWYPLRGGVVKGDRSHGAEEWVGK